MLRHNLAIGMFVAGTAVHAALLPPDAPERLADDRQKVVCKRFLETGSLVKGYRTCKTKWEWERERDNVRDLNAKASCGSESGRC